MPAPEGNQYALGNPGGGRPAKYEERFTDMAYEIALLGATDADLARIFDVSEVTINNWKESKEEFSLSLKRGKDIADAKIAQALYQRAMGYEHEDVDIRVVNHEIVQTPLTKHYPPDTTAGIFWLKNRQPKKWRDKIDYEHGGKDGGPIQHAFNPATMTTDELRAALAEEEARDQSRAT